MQLHWTDLQKYTLLAKESNEQEVSGIYLWGFKSRDNFFIAYYGGKAWKIKKRITEHLSNILGFSYTLFHPDNIEIKNFRRDESIYNPEDYVIRTKGISNRREFQPFIDYMVDNLYFTYAPLSKKDFEDHAEDAERSLIIKYELLGKGNSKCGKPKSIIELGNLKNVIENFTPEL
ncbi:MAG: hypothetical protein KBC43_07275 [Bacteroidales bacterium]|nr:hypothetical protein [Bacteroidales bacterium]